MKVETVVYKAHLRWTAAVAYTLPFFGAALGAIISSLEGAAVIGIGLSVLSLLMAAVLLSLSPSLFRNSIRSSWGGRSITKEPQPREQVVLTNEDDENVDLTGWVLADDNGNAYRFGHVTLRSGISIVVHTGDGMDTSSARFVGSSNYVWNNSGGDEATLRDADGRTVSTCAYEQGGASPYAC